MPREELTESQIAHTQQQLRAAALLLYKNEGAEAVSFRRLAKKTGTSHTRTYRYFADKQALMAALRLYCYERFISLIRENDIVEAAPAQRLQSIHAAIMAYVQAEPGEYQLMFSMEQPPLQDYPELLAVRRQAFDYLVAIVQTAIDNGEMRGDARNIMHIAWGAVHGLLSLHTAGQLLHGRNLEQLTAPLMRTVLHPLFD